MTMTHDHETETLVAWLAEQTWSDFAQSLASYHATKGYLTDKQMAAAKKMFNKVNAKASAKAPAGDPVTEAGMYKTADGTIYKVQAAVHGSGNLYAKQLVVHEGHTFGDKVSFNYAPGVIKQLTAAMKMTLDEAKDFGALYGTCCVCGRTLTDETSIAAGIGPVCAGKGWW